LVQVVQAGVVPGNHTSQHPRSELGTVAVLRAQSLYGPKRTRSRMGFLAPAHLPLDVRVWVVHCL
jgi:hypothetical protein